YHVRHRAYDPELGRWLERDPAGYIDGWSLYQAVNSSPVMYVDPSGMCDCDLEKISQMTFNYADHAPAFHRRLMDDARDCEKYTALAGKTAQQVQNIFNSIKRRGCGSSGEFQMTIPLGAIAADGTI